MTTAYWRRKERLYSFCGLELGLETGSCFNPSQLQPIHRATELQSFRGTKIQNTVKKPLKATESHFRHFLRSCNG